MGRNAVKSRKRNNQGERNEEEELEKVGMEGSRRRESDNRSVFSHRFTQAIALPFSPALINGIIERCGIPLEILLRFHKNQIAAR